MRIGLYYGWELTAGVDAADLYAAILEQVEYADHLGFDSALIGESHFVETDLTASALDLLGALAGSTRSIRLGTAGKALPLQHPARIAEEYAVLDLLSNGRLIAGVGPGNAEEGFAAFGVPFEERLPRFAEALDFIRRAWTHDAFAYGGRYTRFPKAAGSNLAEPFEPEPYVTPFLLPWERVGTETTHLAVTPRPAQIPHPPLWIEADGPEAVTFAARAGCSILPPVTARHEEVTALYTAYVNDLAKGSRSVVEVERPVIREVFVAPSRDEAIEVAGAAFLALYRHHGRCGRLTDAAGQPLADADCTLDRLLDDRLVIGDVGHVFDRLKTLQRRAGINHAICRMFVPGIDHGSALRSIRLFAEEVMMRLRS